MNPTDNAQRPSSQISADIAQKRTRQAALEKRFEETGAELERLRAQQGRALADGTEGPKASDLAAAEEMRNGLRRALSVLADDLKDLDAEAKESAIAEAEEHERECLDAAAKQMEELEALIRQVASSRLIPAADRLLDSVKAAHVAQKAVDRLNGPIGGYVPDRVARRIHDRHGATFTVMDVLRAYVAGKSLPVGSVSAPRSDEKPALALS